MNLERETKPGIFGKKLPISRYPCIVPSDGLMWVTAFASASSIIKHLGFFPVYVKFFFGLLTKSPLQR